jgi:hypothetical protein
MLGEAHNPSVVTPATIAASSDLRMVSSLGRRADGALFGCDVMSLNTNADRFNHPGHLVGISVAGVLGVYASLALENQHNEGGEKHHVHGALQDVGAAAGKGNDADGERQQE